MGDSDEGELSVPAEIEGVVKGKARKGSDVIKHKYIKQESASASLPSCDYHPYFRGTRVR